MLFPRTPHRCLTAALTAAVLGLSSAGAVALTAAPAVAATAVTPVAPAAAPVGATVTTGEDSGPGSLREAVAATQGTGTAIAIDPTVSVITLTSTVTADGDLTLVGAGNTVLTGTADAALALTVTPGSAIAISDLAIENVMVDYSGASTVAVTDVVYRYGEDAPSLAQFASITGDVVLTRVTMPGTLSISANQISGSLVFRDCDLAVTTVSVYEVGGDLVFEGGTIDATQNPAQMTMIVASAVTGDLRLSDLTQTGGVSFRVWGVGGQAVITDVSLSNDTPSLASGPILSQVDGPVTVSGLHVSGLFSEGLTVNGDGLDSQRLTVTDSSFIHPVDDTGVWVTGITANSYGFGGVELRQIRVEGAAIGVGLLGVGQNDEDAPGGPILIEDVTVVGDPTERSSSGIQIEASHADLTVRRAAISEVSRGLLIDGDPAEGSTLEVADSVISTADQIGVSALSFRGATYAEVAITDCDLSGPAQSTLVIDTSTAGRPSAGDTVLIERTTVELTPNTSDARGIELVTEAAVTVLNSTVVAVDETQGALIDHVATTTDGSLTVDYSTLIGADAVSADTPGPVSIDAAALDGAALTTTSTDATITRSALAADRAALTGVVIDAATLDNTVFDLGPLQDNGGATRTMVPLADSPLIDAAGDRDEAASDQRGVARPAVGTDIGAVEIDLGTLAITTPSIAVDGGTTAVLTLTRTGADTASYPLTVALAVTAGDAVLGTDYLAPADSITFPAGVTSVDLAVDTLAVPGGAQTWLTVRATTPAGQEAEGTVAIRQQEAGVIVTPPPSELLPAPDPTDSATAAPTPVDQQPAVRSDVLARTGSGLGLGLLAAAVLALGAGLTALVRRRRS